MLSAVTPSVRLLLVDDNHDFLVSAAAYLRTRPSFPAWARSGRAEEARTLLNSFPVDLVPLAPECRRRALAAGPDGFIGKAEFTTALFPLIARLFPEETR